jgi:hypothetical protein
MPGKRRRISITDLHEILEAALASSSGIRVETNDAQALQQQLYSQRNKLLNADSLKITVVSPTELWIRPHGR